MDERHLIETVRKYFLELGYPKESVSLEVHIELGHIADLVVYDSGKPRIVIEVKHRRQFPSSEDFEELKFHPYVRQAQIYANALNAPYFVLTNGEIYLWFVTDDVGRPRLLDSPIYPINSNKVALSVNKWLHIFQEVRNIFFKGGTFHISDEVSIAIYAKLLNEQGDDKLMQALINSRKDEKLFSELKLLDLPFTKILKNNNSYRDAFEILNRYSFREGNRKDILYAIDEVFINNQGLSVIRLPRWLSDFLVRLGSINFENSNVLDIFSNYGDIFVANFFSNNSENTWTICPDSRSALWTRIQQLILNKHHEKFIIGDVPPYGIYSSEKIPRPNCIIVAPPFNLKTRQDGILPSGFTRQNSSSDEAYLELALNWVCEGGRVISLVPERVLFAESTKTLRSLLLKENQLTAIVSLGSFLPYSKVKTSVLVIDKLPDLTSRKNDVFLANISTIENFRTFNSTEVDQALNVLDKFKFWIEQGELTKDRNVSSIKRDSLDINNFTVVRYLPSVHEKQVDSPYQIVPLVSVVSYIKRGSSITLEEKGELPVIGPAAIRPLSLDFYSLDRTTKDRIKNNSVTVESGNVVVNAISTHRGAAAVVRGDLANSYVSRNVIVLSPKEKLISPEYLAAVLNSEYIKSQIPHITTGSVIPALTVRMLSDIVIPLPDLETQLAIVSNISEAQERVRKAKQHLEELTTEYNESLRNLSLGVK